MFVVGSGDSLRYVSIVRLLRPKIEGEETFVTSGGRFGEVRVSAPPIVATLLEDILPNKLFWRDGEESSCCEETDRSNGDSDRAPKPNDGVLRLKRLLILDSVLCNRGEPFIDPEETDDRLSRYSSGPNDGCGKPSSFVYENGPLSLDPVISCALFGDLMGADTNLLVDEALSLPAGLIVIIDEDDIESAPDETRRLSS